MGARKKGLRKVRKVADFVRVQDWDYGSLGRSYAQRQLKRRVSSMKLVRRSPAYKGKNLSSQPSSYTASKWA